MVYASFNRKGMNMNKQLMILVLLILLGIFAYQYGPTWFSKPLNNQTLTLYGNVDIRQVDLGFRVSGRVLTMPFQEGDFVEKGSLMALLDKQPYEDQVKEARAHGNLSKPPSKMRKIWSPAANYSLEREGFLSKIMTMQSLL